MKRTQQMRQIKLMDSRLIVTLTVEQEYLGRLRGRYKINIFITQGIVIYYICKRNPYNELEE